MSEKKGIVRKSGDLVGAYTHAKAWVASLSVPLTTLIVYAIETIYSVKVPEEIRIAIGMILAGASAVVVPNAKR